MVAAQRIDLMQEFVDLARQEDMLAACACTLTLAGTSFGGLCRFSKPRREPSRFNYLSATFMVDVPDDVSIIAVDAALDRLGDGRLQAAVPVIQEVIPVPRLLSEGGNYVRQVDLMLDVRVDPGREFLSDRLLPALSRLVPLSVIDVIWWNESAEPAAHPSSAQKKEPASLLDRLKALVTRSGGGTTHG
jgi:hypothetical protein